MCAELQIESLDASAVIISGSWYPHVVLGGINFWQILPALQSNSVFGVSHKQG